MYEYPKLTLLEAYEQKTHYVPIHELHKTYTDWAAKKGREALMEDEFVKQFGAQYPQLYFLTVEGVACIGGIQKTAT